MKVLNFTKQDATATQSETTHKTSEVITVNFRRKEIVRMVETDNETNQVVSEFKQKVVPTPFMGEGFGGIVDILLKKHSKESA